MIALPLLLALSPAPQDTDATITLGSDPGSAAQEQALELTTSQLKSEIDRSLHWLRTQQDPETGGYGGVLETVAVLEVMSTSPRAYRPGDGPFVADAVRFLLAAQREDGAVCDADAEAEVTRWQTRMTVRVLERFGGYDDPVARAAEFLGEVEPLPDDPLAARVEESAARGGRRALLLEATGILATRDPEGFWDSERGPMLGSIVPLGHLSSLYRYLKETEPEGEARAAQALPPFDPADRERVGAALERGASFLLAASEEGRWGFGGQPDPGITAMVTGALQAVPEPRPTEVQAAIDGALDWLLSLQKADGSIHAGQLANYVTSASVMALARAGRAEDREAIDSAREFLRALQSDEGDGYAATDRYYGGVGYGGDERPDLSNLQMALEALHDAGTPADDEVFQKALAFLQRCQNRSESNDLVMEADGTAIVPGNDGGAGYAPGESKAGFVELPDGRRVPRSYGSMTYALLKGYLFAGLPKDDPRVEAAWSWLRSNYTLDVNPGFEGASDPTAAYQGLFYYFTTMARALDLYGEEVVVDAEGVEHAWRSELSGRLVAMQRPDGSWINDNAPRWYEGNPVLATSYAMITLATALPE